MRINEIEAIGQFVYHATKAANLGKIMQKGLTFFNDSLWVSGAKPEERYQDGPSVFAFENPLPAFRWAHKIEWDFETPAVIIKLKRNRSWELDPSPDIMMTLGDGMALESKTTIPPSDFKAAILLDKIGTPITTGLAHEEFDDHVKKTLEKL